ncbi:MAG: hypothetical protein R3B72_26630 [Polyangiaceae bacterium]
MERVVGHEIVALEDRDLAATKDRFGALWTDATGGRSVRFRALRVTH